MPTHRRRPTPPLDPDMAATAVAAALVAGRPPGTAPEKKLEAAEAPAGENAGPETPREIIERALCRQCEQPITRPRVYGEGAPVHMWKDQDGRTACPSHRLDPGRGAHNPEVVYIELGTGGTWGKGFSPEQAHLAAHKPQYWIRYKCTDPWAWVDSYGGIRYLYESALWKDTEKLPREKRGKR